MTKFRATTPFTFNNGGILPRVDYANFFSVNAQNPDLSATIQITGRNPKVTAKSKHSDRNPLFTIAMKNIKICYEIKLYKKIIRFVVQQLNDFWLFIIADVCDAYYTKICIRTLNMKYQQVSISFQKKNIWKNDVHQK